MKPVITSANITGLYSLAIKAFELVAKSQHYKTLFTIQKNGDVYLHEAIKKLHINADFADACVKACNDSKNYESCMRDLIENISDFCDDTKIPTRDCDFKVVKNDKQTSYFYVEERVAIHSYNNEYNMCILFVDNKNNKLFFSYENGDMMDYYAENGIVGKAYKDWLAEQELLK
jgi:hypothetical protein